MQVDLEGRVRNISLPQAYGLRPLFEAVVNSIDAISETAAGGKVEVRVLRDTAQIPLGIGDSALQAISSFEIIDSGAGFNSKNWEAFQQCDTTAKVTKGGKGIGRLLFLNPF